MSTSTKQEAWLPDWATHPGEHLAEYIQGRGWSQAEFARIADLTPKLVSTIINGTNPVTPETAIKLEHVLGLKAYVWTGLQANWDLYQARQREKEAAAHARSWLKRFPVKELKACRRLPDTNDPGALLSDLLTFLGIGSMQAYEAKVGALCVHHRKSRSGQSSPDHVLAWLMLGEEQVRRMNLPVFDESRFVQSCAHIRSLTVEEPEIFEPQMTAACASAGVALVFEKPLSKTCVFGSARWLDGERPLIQMSLRMKSNDHFWWTFFHEAAHIVLHRGQTFVDDQNAIGDEIEDEADSWAEENLVGRNRFLTFAATRPRSKAEVKSFASEIGVHPGIIVGMLQHHRIVQFSHMNDLKVRFDWADEVVMA